MSRWFRCRRGLPRSSTRFGTYRRCTPGRCHNSRHWRWSSMRSVRSWSGRSGRRSPGWPPRLRSRFRRQNSLPCTHRNCSTGLRCRTSLHLHSTSLTGRSPVCRSGRCWRGWQRRWRRWFRQSHSSRGTSLARLQDHTGGLARHPVPPVSGPVPGQAPALCCRPTCRAARLERLTERRDRDRRETGHGRAPPAYQQPRCRRHCYPRLRCRRRCRRQYHRCRQLHRSTKVRPSRSCCRRPDHARRQALLRHARRCRHLAVRQPQRRRS